MTDRILDAKKNLKEEEVEISLRPKYLKEYVGQEELKQNLRVFMGAAKHRDETLDHVLLYGPPGLGKTTLAYVIANEMEGNIRVINGPSIERSGDLASILADIKAGDILFIDEIHRLPRVVEEVLYGAMEDFKLSILIPREQGSNTLNLTLEPFTLIGATTRAGDLSSPLRSRFGIVEKINFYSEKEIEGIVRRTSSVLRTGIDEDAVKLIAKRSRGTPRIANRLFRRVRDFANYEGKNAIAVSDARKALDALKVDCLGLDDVDIRYLNAIIDRFHGGPVGLEAVASAIGEEIMNLEDVYEPYLLQIGMINRTPRGRVATEKAYEHLRKNHQKSLF
ncbi:MAG: Holliday junction branch migration DNA helicase RuvB [Bacilli bacterium]|jgi:Holliday junction DNA helicase RuvB